MRVKTSHRANSNTKAKKESGLPSLASTQRKNTAINPPSNPTQDIDHVKLYIQAPLVVSFSSTGQRPGPKKQH